jgi:hypothetical protein
MVEISQASFCKNVQYIVFRKYISAAFVLSQPFPLAGYIEYTASKTIHASTHVQQKLYTFHTMHRPLQVERLNLVVLGDQTNNVSALLKKLLLSAPHSVAQSEFIRDASAALRAQSDRLRPFQREHLPGFKSIHDLARIYEKSNGVCHPSISSALLCVTQLLQIFR